MRVNHDLVNPKRADLMKIYYQEHCTQKKTVAAMSPGSCPGRGAVTLTPDPNGAKVFNITRRAQRGSNKVPKFKRIGVRPLSQGAVKMTANCAGGARHWPRGLSQSFLDGPRNTRCVLCRAADNDWVVLLRGSDHLRVGPS